jgi:hypothetical protein
MSPFSIRHPILNPSLLVHARTWSKKGAAGVCLRYSLHFRLRHPQLCMK